MLNIAKYSNICAYGSWRSEKWDGHTPYYGHLSSQGLTASTRTRMVNHRPRQTRIFCFLLSLYHQLFSWLLWVRGDFLKLKKTWFFLFKPASDRFRFGHIFLFVTFSLLCQLKSLGFVGQISSFVCLNLQFLLLNSTPQWKMWKSNQVDSFIILMMFV